MHSELLAIDDENALFHARDVGRTGDGSTDQEGRLGGIDGEACKWPGHGAGDGEIKNDIGKALKGTGGLCVESRGGKDNVCIRLVGNGHGRGCR